MDTFPLSRNEYKAKRPLYKINILTIKTLQDIF